MDKIFLIMQREYLSRVRKRAFIIMSLLAPLLFGLILIVPALLTLWAGESKTILVSDATGQFEAAFKSSPTDNLTFNYTRLDSAQARTNFSQPKAGYDALLYLPEVNLDRPQGFVLFSEKGLSITAKSELEKILEKQIENQKMLRSGIRKSVLDSIRTNVSITNIVTSESGEKVSSTDAASIVGYLGAFFIYIFIFLYGAQVMRGVLEEKTNRIVEVVISSVKPFQLMMGKILGIGAVAFTQFIIWIVLGFVVSSGVQAAFGLSSAPPNQALVQPMPGQTAQPEVDREAVQKVFASMASINLPLVLACFVFYFIGGYFMYGALFGAVGAMVDNETDTQQFMLPLTIPLILAIVSLGVVISEPDGSLAFWLSMFPLTSPVVMMVRVPFIGANWELFLSMALLVASFVGAVWLAGRIYRVGILMYGKKPTFKEVGKWLFYKG
ncbi:MAG: ABC transporter permease [Bernardetiaceae bacterium]|jgi:ABC-2 type transport system permease protein|nr:ABC transporter permease [Bernardetiaceae bacterium]